MSDAGSDDDQAWKPCGDSLAPAGDVPAPQDDRMYLFRLRCGTGCSLICCNFETAAFLNLTHYARTRSGQPVTVVVESADKLMRWRVRTLHKNQREDYLFWLELKRTGSPQAVTVDGKLYPGVPMIKVLETWIKHSFFAGLRQEHLEALSADHDVHPKIMPQFEHGGIYMKHNFNMLHACSNDMRRELAEVVAMTAAGKIYLSSDANKKALFEGLILVKDYQDIKLLEGKYDSIGPILGQMYTECLGATDSYSAASNQPKHYYNTLAKLMEAYKTFYGAPQLFGINNNLRGGVENQTGAYWLVKHAAEENDESDLFSPTVKGLLRALNNTITANDANLPTAFAEPETKRHKVEDLTKDDDEDGDSGDSERDTMWRILSMLFATNSKPKIKSLAGVLEEKLEAVGKEDETEYSGDGIAEWKKSVLNKMELLHGTKGKPGSWPAFPPIGDGA